MRYSVSPHQKKKFYTFLINKLCIAKILKETTFYWFLVAHWSLLINSRNMAKSAIHKLLTEILYGIKKLI